MTHTCARRLRRVGYVVAAWIGTIAAHVAVVGAVQLRPGALGAFAIVTALAALLPDGGRAFAPRGPVTATTLVATAEYALHWAMTIAPTPFGLELHAHRPVVTVTAVIAHGVVALQLGLLLGFFDVLLAHAVRVVAAIKRLIQPVPRLRQHTRSAPLPVDRPRALTRAFGPHCGRGPPQPSFV